MENKTKIIDVARGDQPGDLLLKNCNIVNVFSSDIEQGNVVITDRKIAGVGDYNNAHEIIDIKGNEVLIKDLETNSENWYSIPRFMTNIDIKYLLNSKITSILYK